MPDIAQLSLEINTAPLKEGQREMANTVGAAGACENAVGALEKAFTGMMAAFAVYKIADQVKDLALLGARYETLGVAMDQVGHNAGYTNAQMATFQEGLQHTGISAIESRDNLTKMAAANLDLAQASRLARVAQDAAVIGNMNSSEAFATLVQGIQSGRTELLHHIGIMPNFETAYKNAAAAVGKATGELTEAEKSTARMNAVLQEGELRAGVYEAAMGTAGKQIKSMERYIQDLEVAAGSVFGPALTTGVEAVTEAIKGAEAAMKAWNASGDGQVFATSMKNDLEELISDFQAVTKFTYQHRDALVMLGGAYAALKISEAIQFVIKWNQEQRAAVEIIRQATIAARVQEAADEAGAAAKARYSATTLVYAEAEEASAVAAARATAAQEALAVAEVEVGTAAASTEAAVAAMGGPFTIIISLLGAAAAAWWTFRDASSGAAKDALANADEQIRKTELQIEAQKKYWALRNGGAAPSEAAKALQEGVDENPAVRALDKAFGEAQSKLYKVYKASGTQSAFDDFVESARKVATDSGVKEAIRAMDEILVKRGKLVEDLNSARHGAGLVEQDQIARAKKTPSSGTGALIGDQDTTTEYGRELARMQEQILTLSHSEREAYEMKLKLMDNSSPGSVAKGMELFDMKALLEWKKEATEAIAKVAEEKRKKDAEEHKRLVDEGSHLNYQLGTPEQKRAADIEHLDTVWAAGGLAADAYHKRLAELDPIIGPAMQAMDGFGNSAVDAFAKWATGMDKAAIHWSNMIRSMMTDFARMMAQQGMSSLLGFMEGSVSDMFSGGSSAISTVNMNTDFSMPASTFNPGASTDLPNMNYSGGSSAPAAQVGVTVNVAANGQSSATITGNGAKALGDQLHASVTAIIVQHQRPGGVLNPVN